MINYTIIGTIDEHFEKEADEALKHILDVAKTQEKWVYLDGNLVRPESITTSRLETCNNITLTNMLMGG